MLWQSNTIPHWSLRNRDKEYYDIHLCKFDVYGINCISQLKSKLILRCLPMSTWGPLYCFQFWVARFSVHTKNPKSHKDRSDQPTQSGLFPPFFSLVECFRYLGRLFKLCKKIWIAFRNIQNQPRPSTYLNTNSFSLSFIPFNLSISRTGNFSIFANHFWSAIKVLLLKSTRYVCL